MKKEKERLKNKLQRQKGITLIALVVTIIVLIILAVISVNLVFNEDGIIGKAQKAKEINEMAQIKEEAEFVKLGLNIDTLTKQNGLSFIQKSKLISELNKHFEGSSVEDGRVVVSNGKYDIIVENNLDIVVVKHGENYLKDDEIGITYEIEDVDKESKKIKVYLEVGGERPTEEEYKKFADNYLKNKSKAELEDLVLKSGKYIGTFDQWLTDNNMTRDQFEQMAQEQGMTYEEYLKYGLTEGMGESSWVYIEYMVSFAGGEGKTQTELENLYVQLIDYPGTFDQYLIDNNITREQFKQIAQEEGYRTEEDFVKGFVAVVYTGKLNEEITVVCSNGETKTTNINELYVELTARKRNGTYTITATTESEKRGEVQIEIADLYEEKFSQIYTEAKEYVDSKGNKAFIPEGYAVGVSDNVNTIEKGLVITDSVDSKGYSNGNEWVWVPVKDVNVMCDLANETEYTLTGTSGDTAVKTKLYSKSRIIGGQTRTTPGKTSDYREPDLVIGNDGTSSDAKNTNYKTILGENGTKEQLAQLFVDEYEKMIESVGEYGGFYIGRYELTANGEKPGPTLTNTNWYNLYNKCKKFEASNKVKSRMIWGCQWDVTCKWLAETEFASDLSKVYSNSSSWGNYQDSTENAAVVIDGVNKYGTKQDTGYSEYWKANNIYDFAGNCYEWTQEAVDTNGRAWRGGKHDGVGPGNPAAYRTSGGSPTYGAIGYAVFRYSCYFNNSRANESVSA